jgi:hypothetical protein
LDNVDVVVVTVMLPPTTLPPPVFMVPVFITPPLWPPVGSGMSFLPTDVPPILTEDRAIAQPQDGWVLVNRAAGRRRDAISLDEVERVRV